jgi:hypothetical protein
MTFVGLSPDLPSDTGLTGDPYRSDRYNVEALQVTLLTVRAEPSFNGLVFQNGLIWFDGTYTLKSTGLVGFGFCSQQFGSVSFSVDTL